MLQKIFNIKKIFQHHKTEARVSANSMHGTSCTLYVTNLALFGVVIMLTITSAVIYYVTPVVDVSKLSKVGQVQATEARVNVEPIDIDSTKEEEIGNEVFSVIAERNMFSHDRKEWVVKAVIPKTLKFDKEKQVKKKLAKKKALAGKPKKIILHGIVIAGDVKKALIDAPLKSVSKKKTLYIEEGDKLVGYTVTSIEKDRIKLDWNGEEIVITLYSGLNDSKLDGSAGKVKTGSVTKNDYTFKTVTDTQIAKNINGENNEVKETAYADTLDKAPIRLMSMHPERSKGK